MIAIVAQYTLNFQKGEQGRFTDIAKYLTQLDKVELITSSFSHSLKCEKPCTHLPKEYKVTFIETPAYKKNISLSRLYSCSIFAKNVRKYLETLENVNLVYCAVPSLDVGCEVSRYCENKKIPMILDIQDLWPDAFYMAFNIPIISNLLFTPLEFRANKLYKKAQNIIAVSETYLERTTTQIRHQATNTLVAFLGTSLKKFDEFTVHTEEKQIEKKVIRVGYIGTLSYSYDITIVIRAIRELMDRKNINVEFLIMGDGPLKEKFEEEVDKYSIQAIFTGKLEYGEMVKMLKTCDIAVNPIVKKSAGSIINKVGDYAAAGLPVINTQECSEYRDLIEKYKCGINCRNSNSTDVANAIEWLIVHPSERITMGIQARKMAEELFDRDVTYRKIQEFVKDIYESSSSK